MHKIETDPSLTQNISYVTSFLTTLSNILSPHQPLLQLTAGGGMTRARLDADLTTVLLEASNGEVMVHVNDCELEEYINELTEMWFPRRLFPAPRSCNFGGFDERGTVEGI